MSRKGLLHTVPDRWTALPVSRPSPVLVPDRLTPVNLLRRGLRREREALLENFGPKIQD